MSVQGQDPDALGVVIRERRRLLAIAYRLLGTVAEAEDAVQEAYVRWYQLGEGERSAIDNVPAWLTRVTSNICLDVLKSARRRREQYVGPWLPEPLPSDSAGSTDPADRVTLDESVSTALLLVLESMTPAERVAFVLHDVFKVPFPEVAEIVGRTPAAVRQLATSARRRVDTTRARRSSSDVHASVVRAFAAACEKGDLQELLAVLDPTVELRSDGGGIVRAAYRPVVGATKAARFLLGVLAKRPEWRLELRTVPEGLAVVLLDDAPGRGAVESVITVQVIDGRIHDIWMMRNPLKLSRWA
jgi:RNA polymerase sigma-70 factor (ECF subfamily)